MQNLRGLGGGNLQNFPTYKPKHRVVNPDSSSTLQWRQTKAFYGRVSFERQPDLYRPLSDFSLQENANHVRGWGVQGPECSTYYRREFLDVGVVNTHIELG